MLKRDGRIEELICYFQWGKNLKTENSVIHGPHPVSFQPQFHSNFIYKTTTLKVARSVNDGVL